MKLTRTQHSDPEAFKQFFRSAGEGAWGLLQHYMCHPIPGDRHMNQTGGGLGGVFTARQRVGIQLNLFSVSNKTQQLGSGEDINKKSIVKIVSPVQQVVEQAKEEIKERVS